ncbi:MAG: type IX secretion system outer membrane channel protein PorV [Candidatus Zixiibacteriota bacterium]
MKRLIIIVAAIALVVSSVDTTFAENAPRLGSAGAQELRLPVSARMMGMAGASLVDAQGTDGLFWNPAGIALSERTEVEFSHLTYIADINQSYLGFVTHFEGIGSFGLSGKIVTAGDIEVTTEAQPNGTGEVYSPTFSVFGVHWARRFTDRITFGLTGHYITESIDRVRASGVAFDMGFDYDPQWQGLKFAIVMKNYGPDMRFGGEGFSRDVRVPGQDPNSPDKTIRQQSAAFELPSHVQLALAWEAWQQDRNNMMLYGSFQSNTFNNDEGHFGGEYSYDETFFLRAGYTYSNQDAYLYGATFGGGLVLKLGETDVAFDYAWTETDVFDANQYFTVKVAF